MDQRELAERHEVRKSMPEQHKCCHAAKRFLTTQFDGDAWIWKVRAWVFMPLPGKPGIALPIIIYCPWCGEKLPDRGRLKVEEAIGSYCGPVSREKKLKVGDRVRHYYSANVWGTVRSINHYGAISAVTINRNGDPDGIENTFWETEVVLIKEVNGVNNI